MGGTCSFGVDGGYGGVQVVRGGGGAGGNRGLRKEEGFSGGVTVVVATRGFGVWGIC